METLGEWIAAKRSEPSVALTQGKLGDVAGVSKQTMQAIESGRIKVPNADIRRRLAKALGVSHLDLLIGAGELTEAEVAEAGKVGVVEERDDDPAVALAERVRRARLSPRDRFVLSGMVDVLEGES